jgi:DNA-binding CsgD family transcriptional regulator
VSTAATPLLEREHALASLREYADSARAGDGRVVLISGEAGAGKTSLIERFERDSGDACWLHGQCDGLFTPRPLGPLYDAAEELGGELLAACRGDGARDELFGHLLTQLREGMTVFAIEDVHWADESTLDLLRFLGRRLRDLPVLLLITYRDDELGGGHPLRLVLGELATQRSTRRIDLARLSERAVRELAADSGIDARALYELSGGNPFFVTEVLQAKTTRIPPSARDAVLARLARLGADARRLAETAALIGTRVESLLVEQVADASAEQLDELLASGLLVSDTDGLRFRHELSRLAVEESVPAHRRKQIHARVLSALRASGCEDEARLAYHADGAEDAAAVLQYAPGAAARASALGSHREAAAQYERALRFVDRNDRRRLAEFYDLLVEESWPTDSGDRAAEAGERALALWRQLGDKHREGAALCHLSRTMWRLCRPESRQYAEEAVALLEPLGPSTELAWAYAAAAKAVMENLAGIIQGVGYAHRAQELATALGLPDVFSDALTTEACLVSGLGGDWQPLVKRALDVAVAAGAQEQAGRAYANIWELLAEHGRLGECEKYLDEGSQYCDEHDLATYGYCLRVGRSEWLLAQGRWDEAIEVAQPLLAPKVSSPANRTTLARTVGRALARRGDLNAWTYLDEVLANAVNSGEPGWLLDAYSARAEAHWLEGDVGAARADLAAAVQTAGGELPAPAAFIATWCRRLGMAVPAVTAPAAEDPNTLLLAGDCEAAAAEWDELGMPYEAALAFYDSGTEEGLREAIRRFEALGAAAAVDATRREMRRLGMRSVPAGARASTKAHPSGLTRRESEVLELICAGRTNAEISAELFVSPRTVDHHVSSVLAKLGVPSRAVAAAEAVRRGLVTVPGRDEN